ncbi:MAG: sorbosone dehydrogenase family protein [Gammaproteobacteria bacterium]
MMNRKLFICHFITAVFFLCLSAAASAVSKLPLHKIKLPSGFNIELYADNVPNARSLVLGKMGTVFVSTRTEGKVYALVDSDNDFRADKKYIIAEDLLMPNGVAFRNGSLFVAAVNRVLRFDNIEQRLADPPRPVIVNDDFPSERAHGWRFIRIGPDNKLYIPVGAPCNVCDKEGYALIARMNLNGSNKEIYARGIRNTVGFDWHPLTGELWFTDNGRDMLGDDVPPDELNHAPRQGMHFGYPYCHGKSVIDPEFGTGDSCKQHTPPAQELGPHVAALGMRFYIGKMFPAEYRNQIFIAEHGSWNRSKKIGYRISLVKLQNNRAVSYTPFATGWLEGQSAWGRPVDIMHLLDGSLLVSDDKAGVIYRISYK